MEILSKQQVTDLKNNVDSVVKDLKIDEKKLKLGELETKSMEEGLWDHPESARKLMSELDSLITEIKQVEELKESATSLLELYEIANDKEKGSLLEEYEKISQKLHAFETIKYLGGKYDSSGAILSLHSGQGGTEANDWTEMLLRMYTRYCERQDWSVKIVHMVPGTEAGLSTVTLHIGGKYAFGKLKHEKGTHRLIRLSPFNSQNLRQTSFAGVEVMPIIEDEDNEITIKESEIEFKAVRAGGPGGQNVNKTSTAVQILHISTGITVHCSTERSQEQNRQNAMKILRAKLWEIEEEKRQNELKQIKGEHKIAGWGNQIRNYVLHPYKLVKDLRTGVESSEPEKVLDGELEEFVEAEIRIQ